MRDSLKQKLTSRIRVPLHKSLHMAVHALDLASSQIDEVDVIRSALGSMETVVPS